MDERKIQELKLDEMDKVSGGQEPSELTRDVTCKNCQFGFTIGALRKKAVCPNCGENNDFSGR